MSVKVSPSVLTADFLTLKDDIKRLEEKEEQKKKDSAYLVALAEEKQAEALRMARAETDMLRRTSRRYWRAQIMAARECYGYNPDPSPLARACAGLWGLIVYAVAVQWRRLMAAMGME